MMEQSMKITTEPRSDQWNAEDFIGGPRTFTIAGVRTGSAEQKYDIDLVEGGGRAWRPPLTVLRLLVAAWGDDAKEWIGRFVTLYRDPSIRFGRDEVGGIRVSHVSHIDAPVSEALTVTRGKRASFTLQPMPRDVQLRAEWKSADPERRKVIEAEVNRLSGTHEQGAGSSEVDTVAPEVDADGIGTSQSVGPAPDDDSGAGVEPARHEPEPGEPSAAQPPSAAEGKPATRRQLVAIHQGLADFELDRDGADDRRLWVLSTIAGRAVQAPEDLTEPEAKAVADTFEMAERSISKLREMVEAIEAAAS